MPDAGHEPHPLTAPTEDVAALSPDLPAIPGYRLVRVLGTGGMGAVYEAIQESPKRSVALKLMRPGLASESALQRFKYESQILAHLRHPGIAQVYESGTTALGGAMAPWYAMEYIPGATPLTDDAERRDLDLRDRVRMFMQVCEAVQHGHQRGVIHRDLKPNNILVDSGGQPKIIDFGVSRSLNPGEIREGDPTIAGELVGTPAYMSPEQVAGDPRDLDTRSDVYSLGVILFRLVTGRLPVDVKGMSIYDAVRVIAETSAPRASAVAAGIPADLDRVIAKALRRDRDQRYPSARALRDDLDRFLEDRPILARPPSVMYRARKFARRHRGSLGAVAVALVILGAFGARSIVAEARAMSRDADARAVSEFLFGQTLGALEPQHTDGAATTARDMLDRVAPSIDEAFGDRAELRRLAHQRVGVLYYEWGELDRAGPHLRAAAELAGELHGPRSLEHAETSMFIAALQNSLGHFAEADRTITGVLSVFAARLPADDPRHASALRTAARVAERMGETGRAESLLRDAIGRSRRVGAADHEGLAEGLVDLARVLTTERRLDEAEESFREAIDIQRRGVGTALDRAVTTRNYAFLLHKLGRSREALPLIRDSMDELVRMYGDKPHAAVAASAVSSALVFEDVGEHAECDRYLDLALETYRRCYDADHEFVAQTQGARAQVLSARGDDAAAAIALDDAVRIFELRFGPRDRRTAMARLARGKSLTALERYEDAERDLLAAVGVLDQDEARRSDARAALRALYGAWGRGAEAERWSDSALPAG